MNYFGVHHKSAWHCFLTVLGCWMFTMAWSPAARAQTCVSENLATLIATTPTCNIGSIQFTFDGVAATNFVYDYGTKITTPGTAYTASDFTFTPVSNGFTLTFDGGPQSITGPANGYAQDNFNLLYSAVDTTGSFTGESVTGGTLTATGSTHSEADYTGDLCSDVACDSDAYGYNEIVQYLGAQNQYNSEDGLSGPPFSNGAGGGNNYPFYLEADFGGSTATWDGTPTTFTYDTVSPTPEPTTMLLFATGLLGILLTSRKKRFA